MTMAAPEFDQYTEYVDESGIYAVMLDSHDLDSAFTLQVLREGYQHVRSLGRNPRLTQQEIDAVKVRLSVQERDTVTDDPLAVVNKLIAARPDRPVQERIR